MNFHIRWVQFLVAEVLVVVMVEVLVVAMAVVVVVAVLVPGMGNLGTGIEISPGGLGGSGRLSVSK